jgi:hypothetical protein
VTDKATFRISSAAAPYVGADKPRQDRLKAAAGQVALPPTDLVLLVYYLCHDTDPEVKRTAMATLRGLEVSFLTQLLENQQLHPRILDALVQLHFKKPELAPLFAAHPTLSEKAAAFLAAQGAFSVPQEVLEEEFSAPPSAGVEAGPDGEPGEGVAEDEPLDEQSDEFQSKYQLSQGMGVGERIKAALTGDKEWRGILIKDSNKLVSGSVIRNPRITEGEVLTISKSQVQNDEIMRVICANKDWLKNPLIRKALVENHKTPLPVALRLVSTLTEKDLALLAKSKNISSVVASQARRVLFSKKNGR